MYGTVNELAARLLRDYPADEMLTLIIWSREDVRDFVADLMLTEEEAGRILADIDNLHETHECGVGEVTVRIMAENMREEARALRDVTVPAHALENVVRLAAEFLRMAEIECGEGAAKRLYEQGPDAVAKIRRALEG
ncbi:Conserved uncharacterized protein (plasmid) [Erwinia billingiae Eb661]|uniref:Conserved uncharacterized protein n=1 Tax=Erwinia billingiae (strain Eb661) TaxID=634500 RepID=D8MK26_ERWBE|nr:DUF1380 family protein [Erwinia billingiae]CAX53624.1 Conserved uncharacterized protein [Erwinia billingiae Eb661]